MTFENNFERVNFLVCLLFNGNDDLMGHQFTISEVSEKFDIPISLLREDLALFAETPFFSSIKIEGFDNDCEEDDVNDDPENENARLKEKIDKIKKGECDNKVMTLESNALKYDYDKYRIPLSISERALFGDWFSATESVIVMKEMPYPISRSLRQSLEIINKAIESDEVITYDYKMPDGTIRQGNTIKPIKIRISSENPGRAMCIASNGVLVRVDRMMNLAKKRDETFKDEERADICDDWDAIWGLPSGKDTIEGETHHVVLKIKRSTPNIIEKINADISRRKNKTLRDAGNDLYIYEDDISGFNDFKTWIWRYGSSVKVIEPEWLAQKIKADYETIQKQYETGEFID